MKQVLIATSAIFVATASLAAMSDLDTDGDGVASFTEMLAVYPSITEDGFTAVDTSGDGVVDDIELAAAEQSGLLPASGG